jgi:hypothetical protein
MFDLQATLETYHLQLQQQVDAALFSDPTNDELLKLKTDVSEVIELTEDLLAQQGSSSMDADDDEVGAGSSSCKLGDIASAASSSSSKTLGGFAGASGASKRMPRKESLAERFAERLHIKLKMAQMLTASYIPEPADLRKENY